jgi:hypothetical protein
MQSRRALLLTADAVAGTTRLSAQARITPARMGRDCSKMEPVPSPHPDVGALDPRVYAVDVGVAGAHIA